MNKKYISLAGRNCGKILLERVWLSYDEDEPLSLPDNLNNLFVPRVLEEKPTIQIPTKFFETMVQWYKRRLEDKK